MVHLTVEEIQEYRNQLITCPDALKALEAIEDSEGDLEDAATSLAILTGQKLDRVDWFESVAKRCRVAICEAQFREELHNNAILSMVNYLLEQNLCPPLLVTPVVIYVLKQGLEEFCKPLTYKLS